MSTRAAAETRVAALLADAVRTHGAGRLADTTAVRSLLNDLLGEQAPALRREVALLAAAAAEGVPALLTESLTSSHDAAATRLTGGGFDAEGASWAVRAWAAALGTTGSPLSPPPAGAAAAVVPTVLDPEPTRTDDVITPAATLLDPGPESPRPQRCSRRRPLILAVIVSLLVGTGAAVAFVRSRADDAPFLFALGTAVDPAGNVYVADQSGNRVVRVGPTGRISTEAGTGDFAGTRDGNGQVATDIYLSSPSDVALDAKGNLYIASSGNLFRVDPGGRITTVAGDGSTGEPTGDGGPAKKAHVRPDSLAVDAAGNLYFGERFNERVRRIDPAGRITTVAGNGERGFSSDGGPATAARVDPADVAVDSLGNLLIADAGANRIRKVTPDGRITTVVGTGRVGSSGDGGPATSAELRSPDSIAVDRAGRLYIADDESRVRRVDPKTGLTSTVAGNGAQLGDAPKDGEAATSAPIFGLTGLSVDAGGALYFMERHSLLRRVDPAGIITTLA